MRLAHLADPHLGFRQYHRQTATGINQREADVAQAFRAAVDGVIAARPDAVIVAGDLFHAVRPTNAAIVFAFRQFQRLREALPDAPVVLIAGNHDTPRSTETGSILRLYEELGVDVATDDARRFHYPALDLEVLAVPHAALAGERPALLPGSAARWQVLTLHGEVEGVLPVHHEAMEYGGARVAPGELTGAGWHHVALGHYHVRHEVSPRVWYAGALEYASSNIWGELAEERQRGVRGKGWLLADLAAGTVTPMPVPAAREVRDLPWLDGEGLGIAELDALLAARIGGLEGGLAGRVVRQVVRNVPRHVARQLDHAAHRAWKAEALHLQLEFRRPEVHREVGMGAPGRRQTLPEVLEEFLRRRPLPAEVERERFVRRGAEFLARAEA